MNKLSALALTVVASLAAAACTIVTQPGPGAQQPATATEQPAAAQPTATAPAANPRGRIISVGRTPPSVQPVGTTAPATPGKLTGANMFGAQAGSPNALKGEIFWINPGTTSLPDLDKMTPAATMFAEVINSPPREFTEGFPGVDPKRVEWFAIRFTGQFNVAAAGDYTFKLHSKDGAKVYVDNQLIVDNDGQHGSPVAKSGPVKLSAGQHALRVDYFKGAKGVAALQLMVIGADKLERPWLPSF
jgi:hypothetical protein